MNIFKLFAYPNHQEIQSRNQLTQAFFTRKSEKEKNMGPHPEKECTMREKTRKTFM